MKIKSFQMLICLLKENIWRLQHEETLQLDFILPDFFIIFSFYSLS